MLVALERLPDGVHRVGPGIDQFRRSPLPRRHHPRPVGHPAVRDRGDVFHHQHLLALDLFRLRHRHPAGGLDHGRLRVVPANVGAHLLDCLRCGRIHFVDNHHIGPAQVHLSREVGQLVPGPQRVSHYDFQIRAIEGRVVVAAVPEDQVGFLLGLPQDGFVVGPGIDHRALTQVGLILLLLLNGALVPGQVVQGGEALHALGSQIAVGHGMAHHHQLPAQPPQFLRHPARGGALAAAGSHRAHRHYRHPRRHLCAFGPQQPEVGPGRHRPRGQVHHRRVGDVAVGEDYGFRSTLADQRLQLLFCHDGNPFRIERAGQLRRIGAVGDVGNLRGCERHHPVVRVVPIHYVEVVEIPPCCSQNDDPLHSRAPFPDFLPIGEARDGPFPPRGYPILKA